jgi:hypothetical protein
MVAKTCNVSHLGNFKEAAARYSPAEVVKTEKKIIIGEPEITAISTSHVEKSHPADALPKAHTFDQCFQQEVGKLSSCGCFEFRVLQLLQAASRH